MSAVGELTVSIIGDMSKLSSTFSKASSEVGKFGSSVSSLGSSMTSKVGSALTAVGTAAAVTGTALGVGLYLEGKKSISMFNDFEKSVSNAASVTGLTGQAFKDAKENISAVAMELGQKTSFSSSQAADALYNLASAGVDVSKVTSGQLVPVLSLASGTQYDLADTTAIVTSTLSQFGLQFESAGRVSDVFAKSAALSQASMDKLKYSMAQVGTVANSSGLSLEDTTAALSKMYDAGMDGSSAGTGLKGVIASLMAPTSQATAIFKSMGLTLEDISPASNKFSDIIEKLKQHGLDSTKAFQLFGREGTPAIMALVNQSDGLKTMTEQLKEAGGAAQTMADLQLDTLSGSLDSLSGSIENVFISVGQTLAPTIRSIATYLTDIMPDVQHFIVGIVESFNEFVGKLVSSVDSLGSVVSIVYDIFRNIFEAIFGETSSFGDRLANTINGIFDSIENIFINYGPEVETFLIGIIDSVKALIAGLEPTYNNIKIIIDNIINTFKAFFSGLAGSVTSSGVVNAISGTINSITGILAQLSTVVSGALIAVVPTIKGVFSSIVATIQNVDWQGIFNTVKSAFEMGVQAIKSAVDKLTPIWNILKGLFDSGKQIFTSFVSNLGPTWDNIGLIFYSLERIFSGASQSVGAKLNSFTDILGNASTKLTTLSNEFKNSAIGKAIADVLNTITTSIASFTMSVAENGLTGAIEQAFNIDLSGITSIIDSLKSTFNSIDFAGIFNSVLATVEGIDFTGIFNTIKTSITGFISDLSPTWDNLKSSFDSIKTIVSEVYDDVKPILDQVVIAFAGFFSSFDSGDVSSAGSTIANIINTISEAIAGLLKWLADNPKVVEFALALVGVEVALSAIIPVVLAVAGFIGGLIATVTGVIGVLAGSGGLSATLVAIASTAFPGISTAIGFLASTVFPALMTVIGTIVSTILPGLATALGVLLSPIGLVVISVAALYLAWKNNWFGIRDTLNSVISAVIQTLSGWYYKIVITVAQVLQTYEYLKSGIQSAWNYIKSAISNAANAVITTVTTWYNNLNTKYSQVKTSLQGLYIDLQNRWNSIKTSISTATTSIISTLQSWYSSLQGKFNTVKSAVLALYNDWNTRWNNLKTSVSNLTAQIVAVLQTWYANAQAKFALAKQAVQQLISDWSSKWTKLKTTVSNLANQIVSTLQTWYNNVQNKFSQAKQAIQQLISDWSSKWNTLKSNVSNASNHIVSTLQTWYNNVQAKFNSVKTAASNLLTTWKKKWDDMINTAKTAGSNIVSALSGIPGKIRGLESSFLRAGEVILDALYDSITSGFNKVIKKAKSMLSDLKDLMPNSPAKTGPFHVLPNWDTAIYDPLNASISKIRTLSTPLSNALADIRSPLDTNMTTGLKTVSNVTNSSVVGDTVINVGPVSLSNTVDLQALSAELNNITANQRRQRGVFL